MPDAKIKWSMILTYYCKYFAKAKFLANIDDSLNVFPLVEYPGNIGSQYDQYNIKHIYTSSILNYFLVNFAGNNM